ncbi:hypothetical protein LN42_00580 [Marinitoga sp. 1137]|uniref:hypothetical protein n=1 Tax=Marinitoga sp. 1137 TaxID=1545835 RepID=UPI0009508A86|nr:hypothetical protein [Marinitoga sp. 1137]APT75056.1 hypothetical protein LN42_00580 [Marinitoga sp. 1137]
MFDNKIVNMYFFDRLPKYPITIRSQISVSQDPITRKIIRNYSEQNVYAYIGSFSKNEIEHSNNKLTIESKKVILKDIDINTEDIVVIDGEEYQILYLNTKQNLKILGVEKK